MSDDYNTSEHKTIRERNAEEDASLAWKRLRSESLVKDQWIDFRRVSYVFPDGSVFEPFYTYSRRSYVVVVASDEEGRFLCVRQFRQGIEEVTTEFPAGGVEDEKDGDKADSSVLEAAKRELLEETGYVSEDWKHLLTVPSNATMADNYAYVFRAKNCRRVSGQHLDATEFLNTWLYRPEDIEALIADGKFQQAIHIMAWLLAEREDAADAAGKTRENGQGSRYIYT